MTEGRAYITRSPEETETLGEELSKGFSAGERVALVGELGAGKTRLIRGVAKGFGSRGFVKSPSFTIINIYEGGRLPLYHIDLYRIERAEDLHSAGLEEFIYGNGVSVIEWADRLPALMEECEWVIELSHKGESEREIKVARRAGKLEKGKSPVI